MIIQLETHPETVASENHSSCCSTDTRGLGRLMNHWVKRKNKNAETAASDPISRLATSGLATGFETQEFVGIRNWKTQMEASLSTCSYSCVHISGIH